MIVSIYIIVLTLIFAMLWWGAKHIAHRTGSHFLNRIRDDAQSGIWNPFTVFSAESPNSTEGEFIDDKLSENNKLVWFFRILFASVYLILILLILLKR